MSGGLAVWQEVEKRLNVKLNWQTSLTYTDVLKARLSAVVGLADIYCIANASPARNVGAGPSVP